MQPIVDMTANRHFCEVFFEDVRVPVENLVGELNGSFKQVMRQMEHERGGIDRLVENRALYLDTLERVDAGDARSTARRSPASRRATGSAATWSCGR